MTITVSYTPQNHPFTIHLSFFFGFYHASPAQHPQNFARIFLGIKAIKGLLMGKDLSTVSLKAEWCPNGTPQWCPNGVPMVPSKLPVLLMGFIFFLGRGVNSDCKRMGYTSDGWLVLFC